MRNGKAYQLWETPFAAHAFPSVRSLSWDEGLEVILHVHATEKTYRISFPFIVALKCFDETLSASHPKHQPPGCTLIVSDSNWCREDEEARALAESFGAHLTHYVILGGDRVVEVLSADKPTIIEALPREFETPTP